MTSYCLIHGSGQGPAGWALVADVLRRRGHRVLTPAFDLDRVDEGITWHAETVIEALRDFGADPADVVCVAHSGSGIYLPVIAEHWRPQRMVFLAALVPRPGMSVIEQFRAEPSMFNPAWVGQNPFDDQVAIDFVFHDCPAHRLEWALSTRVYFHAKRALEQRCPLQRWPSVPSAYVACAQDRTIAPDWQLRVAREWLQIEPIVLPSGHSPQVSRPEALSEVLECCAA